MDKFEFDPNDRPVISTSYTLNEFLNSTVWRDISDELKTWLKDIRTMATDPDGTLSAKALYRLGGNAQAVERFLLMPQILMEAKKQDEERASKKPKKGSKI